MLYVYVSTKNNSSSQGSLIWSHVYVIRNGTIELSYQMTITIRVKAIFS
jgi:hypothetical protein